MYKQLFRPIFFSLDPEAAHDCLRSVACIANLDLVSSSLSAGFAHRDSRLKCNVGGLELSNPVGLAAGFDKNAEMFGLFKALGFGHVELGTVTAVAQPGNPRPRIFRFAKDEALVNRMGFPSAGAQHVAERLAGILRSAGERPVVGINIGKSKEVSIERAVEDYTASFRILEPYADYVAVNVSSPNTEGLRQMQERERLCALLKALMEENRRSKPIFVKVAPDLTHEQIDDVVAVCFETGVRGIIATNTTITRVGLSESCSETGGLSGVPLHPRALEVVRYLSARTEGRLPIIGVGGVRDGASALEMLSAGASAVQVYTALVYEGPMVVKRINQELSQLLDRSGCPTLAELVALQRAGGVRERPQAVVAT